MIPRFSLVLGCLVIVLAAQTSTISQEETPRTPSPPLTANHLFQMADYALQKGRYPQAISAFQDFRERFPRHTLSDYAVYYLGIALKNSGEYEKARTRFTELRTSYPLSVFVDEARIFEAETFYAEQQWGTAIREYKTIQQDPRYQDHALFPEFTVRLGYCYEQSGQVEAALKQYHQARFEALSSPFYATAKRHEDRLLRQHPALQTGFSPAQQLKDAKKLVNAKPDEAIACVKAAQQRKLSASQQEQALLLLAQAHYALRDNRQALALYQQILQEYPKSQSIPRIYDRIARLYLRLKDLDAFFALHDMMLKTYPTHSVTAEIMRLKGKEFQEMGQFEQALSVYDGFMTRFPNNWRIPEILLHVGWSNYQLQRYHGALNAFSRLARAYPKSSARDDAIYWAGRSAEYLKHFTQAVEWYQQTLTLERNSHYAFLSRKALTRLRAQQPDVQIEIPPGSLPALPFDEPVEFTSKRGKLHQEKAQALQEVNRADLAAREFAEAIEHDTSSRAKYLSLAELYIQGGAYHQLYQVMWRKFMLWISQGDENVPERFWKLAYPLAFDEPVQKYAAQYRVDPFLVLSMMMAESALDPHAYAPDGGAGLMQLMPATGNRLAKDLNMPPPEPDEYFNPDVNIQLGTYYVSQIQTLFNNQIPPTIASYNAGERTVQNWWKDGYADNLPEFIASIPYPVTKRHVQRVLWYYREYQRIYRKQ